MSSAILRLSTFMSLTSTFRSTVICQAPLPCPQTTVMGQFQCLAALTPPHTATPAAMALLGAERAQCLLPPPPPARWAVFTLKRSSWVPATTVSTPMARHRTPITAPTAARLASPQPHRLRQLQRLSPAPSVTILTFRAPATTTVTPATPLASTSTPTFIQLGPTAAPF